MILEIDVHTFWHAGTGRGDGTGADAVLVRTPGGLPYLPGTTLRGLLREACALAEQVGALPSGRAVAWFGTDIPRGDAGAGDDALEEARFRTVPGLLRVGEARLGDDAAAAARWEAWAAANPAVVAHLSVPLSSTRVDREGVAADHTLRSLEVAAPLRLRAAVTTLDGASDGEWAREMATAVLPLLRDLGAHRNRGLGRATFRRVA